jgi:hypothetical protein
MSDDDRFIARSAPSWRFIGLAALSPVFAWGAWEAMNGSLFDDGDVRRGRLLDQLPNELLALGFAALALWAAWADVRDLDHVRGVLTFRGKDKRGVSRKVVLNLHTVDANLKMAMSEVLKRRPDLMRAFLWALDALRPVAHIS